MGNEIFEEIKKKYEKSKNLSYFQQDSFYVDKSFFESMGKLIQIIETMNKRKLQDMTFEYFNDNELQSIVGQYLEDFLKEIIKRDYISKRKIKAKILECRKILYSFEKELELKANKDKFIHKESMNCLLGQISILQSLLEKEE